MPLYVLGLNGAMRRTHHYANLDFQPYFITAAFGAALILIGIVAMLIQIYVSIKNRHELRDITGDPWNGRTLEWSVSSPAPFYNFAVLPTVNGLDQLWIEKEENNGVRRIAPQEYQPIHMPRNTPAGFIIAMFAGVFGFAMIWQMPIPGIVGFVGIIATVIVKSFFTDTDYYVDADTVKNTELAHIKECL